MGKMKCVTENAFGWEGSNWMLGTWMAWFSLVGSSGSSLAIHGNWRFHICKRNRRRKPHKPVHGFFVAIFLAAMESPSNPGEKRKKETVKITHPLAELSRIEAGDPAHIYHLSIWTPSRSFPSNKAPCPRREGIKSLSCCKICCLRLDTIISVVIFLSIQWSW